MIKEKYESLGLFIKIVYHYQQCFRHRHIDSNTPWATVILISIDMLADIFITARWLSTGLKQRPLTLMRSIDVSFMIRQTRPDEQTFNCLWCETSKHVFHINESSAKCVILWDQWNPSTKKRDGYCDVSCRILTRTIAYCTDLLVGTGVTAEVSNTNLISTHLVRRYH